MLDVTACQNDVISCRAASGRILAREGLCIGCECFIISCFTFTTRKLAVEALTMEAVSVLLFLVLPSQQGN